MFGFNGMEKDDEVKGAGNSLDFGARMYDSRLGRFLSIDPYQIYYPSVTSYGFAANTPILAKDKDGKFPWISGAIGAVVNVGVGLIVAQVTGTEYSWADAGKDALVGFAVGSGLSFLAPAVGITSASSTLAKISIGALGGMLGGGTGTFLRQSLDIADGSISEYDGGQIINGALFGLATGTGSAVMGRAIAPFLNRIGDKRLSELSRLDYLRWRKIQMKEIKRGSRKLLERILQKDKLRINLIN